MYFLKDRVYVAQTGPKLDILLFLPPPLPKCWKYEHIPTLLAFNLKLLRFWKVNPGPYP
jgi:hypothetical protein